MERRQFIQRIGAVTGVLGAGALLGACGNDQSGKSGNGNGSESAGAPAVNTNQTREWRMVTAWPKNFPGLGTGAEYLAKLIGEMSGGRIQVKVYGAGELVPAFESFGAVSAGTAELGHAAAYYWKGKSEAAQFFTAVPFGLTGQEMNAWIYHGGGLELWEEIYDEFGLVPNPAGNTGVQMGGWFRNRIDSLDDLDGLKMRIPGLGGEVLERLGGTPVSLPGGEIFTSLQTGKIDATEWVGPYNDKAFGLHKAASNYYYPGFHEPGSSMECFINKKAFLDLPRDLQSVVRNACKVANLDMLSDFTAKNNQALQSLIDEEGVTLRRFPDEVLKQLLTVSEEVVAEVADRDPMNRKVFDSYNAFRRQAIAWHDVSERAYLNARGLV